MKAFEILLSYACNEKCLFCSQEAAWRRAPGLPKELVLEQLFLAAKEGYRSVCFTGGEPTMRPDLPMLAECAKRLGYRYIRVQTNGLRLARPEYVRELTSAGANFFRVSVHGHTPELHDSLVKVPGALVKVRSAMENLRAAGAGTGINVVLNRMNCESLPELCADFLDRGWSNFVLIFPLFEGDMVRHEEEMGLSMEAAAPAVRWACDVFRERGARLPWLLNFTPCALPELADRMLSWSAHSALVVDDTGDPVDLYMASHDNRAKTPRCGTCALERSCLGFKSSYLARFPAGLPPVGSLALAARSRGDRILREEDGLFSSGRTEVARALQPSPEQTSRDSLRVERMKIVLDPARRVLDEDRAQWSVPLHA